ncbi:MAG: hypothetical protein IT545_12340 [Rhodobacteraceae bacterium]|nr:hypothetical protein [Paracoccaceae bacterium]
MRDRLDRWYRRPAVTGDPWLFARRRAVARLSCKLEAARYAYRMGIPIPERLALADSPEGLDFDALPERVVVKPHDATDSDAVSIFRDGVELFTGEEVPREGRRAFVAQRLRTARYADARSRLIAERYVEDYEPRFLIPRDFKVFVAGGRARVIYVNDINGPPEARNRSHWDRDWRRLPLLQSDYVAGPDYPRPPHLDQLLAIADRIAEDLGCFMRLDFFMTATGVLFGEFTSYPNAGCDFTPIGDALLCDLMDRFPDPF